MLKGDLTSTPLAPLLRDLADDSATGCLHVTNPAEEEALIFFKNGLVYSVSVPGTRPQLGAKLVSSGALAPEALAEALEAQRTELQGWRLGELLVHLGYVDQPVVEAFVLEQVNEALWDLLRWTDGRWKFRKNIRAREDIGPPMVVVELLATLRDRGYEWENISAVVHGPAAVPVLSARGGGSAETVLDNDAWSMLCKIDGERSVADLARDCGYTLFEAGQVIVQLVQAGLVDIDEDVDLAGSELYGASTLSSALAGDFEDAATPAAESADEDRPGIARPTDAEKEDVLARLARLVNEVAGEHPEGSPNGDHPDSGLDADSAYPEPDRSAPAVALAPPLQSGVTSFDNPMIVPLHRHSTESFAASIARVSNALSDVLGETPAAAEVDNDSAAQPVALKRSRTSSDPESQRKRLRSAAAAELATAQAMVETLRADGSDTQEATEPATVDEMYVLPEAPDDEYAASAVAEQFANEQAEAERLAAEEAERYAAEQAEAERLAEEQAEADRIAAEELAAQEAAELERQEAERLAAEEAERLAAEELAAQEAAELERIEAERVATDEAERAALEELAWAEYWQREGEERAAAEQAEAERVAAEEAERYAAEQAEGERVAAEHAEYERLVAEQAEAERLAAEEAERLAAEQAELERLAAERAEAERVAAEEAERYAAELERLAAEQAEAERVAAEEAERYAAEYAELERMAAEQAEAEQSAAEEAERLAAEEAAQLAAAEAEAERLATDGVDQLSPEEVERAEQEEATRDAATAKEERAARRKAEREAAEDAARESDEAAAATALLIELAAASQAEAAEEPEPEPEPEIVEQLAVDEPDDAESEQADEPWSEAGQADTAALLRELSSLGLDDDEPSAPTTTQHKPRPNAVDKKSKKKIGIFGL
jgi:hypothetical protein